jgi:hypothetical protein
MFLAPAAATANGGRKNSREVVVRLPPRWKVAKDAEGRVYYYNTRTKETSWEPPKCDDESSSVVERRDDEGADSTLYNIETASTESEGDKDDDEDEEDDGDTDDEDDEEEGENGESGANAVKRQQAEMDILASSDLSVAEKELLLANKKKKSKEERQHERRQKRERDREKREYERKRRRERHGKHRKDGLVTEHLIPVSFNICLFRVYDKGSIWLTG